MSKKEKNVSDFVENSANLAFILRYDSDTDGIRIYNNNAIEINPEQAEYLLKGIQNYYGSFSEDEKLELVKKQIEDTVKQMAYWYGSPYSYKEFRKDIKRHWGFKCGLCGNKVSSKTHNGYWVTNIGLLHLPEDRYCSETCVESVFNAAYQDLRVRMYKERGISLNK